MFGMINKWIRPNPAFNERCFGRAGNADLAYFDSHEDPGSYAMGYI